MSAYTTYDFYTDTYLGDLITGSSVFEKYEAKAEVKIDRICHNRFADGLPEDSTLNTKVQKAVCAICDVLYQLDVAKTAATATDGSNVRSMSSGGESITFGVDKTEITAALSSIAAQDRLIYQTVLDYLSGSGLLYAGLESCNE